MYYHTKPTGTLVKIEDGVDIYVTSSGSFYADLPGRGRVTRGRLRDLMREIRKAKMGVPCILIGGYRDLEQGPEIVEIVEFADGKWRTATGGRHSEYSSLYAFDQAVYDELKSLKDQYVELHRRWQDALEKGRRLHTGTFAAYRDGVLAAKAKEETTTAAEGD